MNISKFRCVSTMYPKLSPKTSIYRNAGSLIESPMYAKMLFDIIALDLFGRARLASARGRGGLARAPLPIAERVLFAHSRAPPPFFDSRERSAARRSSSGDGSAAAGGRGGSAGGARRISIARRSSRMARPKIDRAHSTSGRSPSMPWISPSRREVGAATARPPASATYTRRGRAVSPRGARSPP